MKVSSKFQFAVLVLLIVTVVYVIALYQSVQAYINYKRSMIEEHPWTDFEPFWISPFANGFGMFLVILTFSWISLGGYLSVKGKAIKGSVLVIITLLFFATTLIGLTKADTTVAVDVLCAYDKEMEERTSFGKSYLVYAKEHLDRMKNAYKNDFDIEFSYNWTTWESDDAKTDLWDLLIDAMTQLDWYWSKDGLELLIVLTGQDAEGYGLSFPWDRAMIMRFDRVYGITDHQYHEMGHQFYLRHCGVWNCWMNPDYCLVFGECYCENCKSTIMANRELLVKMCAMKTATDGYFYVPSVAPNVLKINLLFDDYNIIGDQVGDQIYPDGTVGLADLTFLSGSYGKSEGQSCWQYMADFVEPYRIVGMAELVTLARNYGKTGTYITDLSGVTVTFDTGEVKSPVMRLVLVPSGATSFIVKRNNNLIGAMIIF